MLVSLLQNYLFMIIHDLRFINLTLVYYHCLDITIKPLDRCCHFLQMWLQFWIYKDDVGFLYKYQECYVLQEDLLDFLVMTSNFDFNFGTVQSHLRGAFRYLVLEYLVSHLNLYCAFVCWPVFQHDDLHHEHHHEFLFLNLAQTGTKHFI